MTYVNNYANFFNSTWASNAQTWLKNNWNFYSNTNRADLANKNNAASSFPFYGVKSLWNADRSRYGNQLLAANQGRYVQRQPLGAFVPSPFYKHGPPDSPANRSANGGGTSGLHQFVTRYTIEPPDDPAKVGVEICLQGDDLTEPVVEVDCGGNKGLLYVSKLCQGSKGQSILFNDEWLTPNEFQFISGRETAKDWKRSIRHCGKSLKTLMTKGILQVHPPVCECDYCKGHGPATAEKVAKKKSHGLSHDRQNSNPETVRSGGSTTPSSTESTTPLSAGISDAAGAALYKPGREGGLNSIISQLHNKKASSGNDVTQGSGEESLDLSARASSRSSPASVNGRKRPRDAGHKRYENGREEDLYFPMKRRYSNEDDLQDPFPMSRDGGFDNHSHENRQKSTNSGPLCLSSNKSPEAGRDGFFTNGNLKNGRKGNSLDCNGVCGRAGEGGRNHSSTSGSRHSNKNNSTPPSHSSQFPDFFGSNHRGYRPNLGYSEYALFDAMKRAVANATGSYPDGVRTPPPSSSRRMPSSSSPHTGRSGFINLDSTSRRYGVGSPHLPPARDQPPMVELTSPQRKRVDQYDYSGAMGRQRGGVHPFDAHALPHKAPVTVLHHHPNQYDNSLMSGHRQSGPATPHTHHYYAMPPPSQHGYGIDGRRSGSRNAADRARRLGPFGAPRFDRRGRQAKSATRKSAPAGSQQQTNSESGRNGDHRMVDLHNHAIPMLSLTYSKKKSNKSLEKENGRQSYERARNTDSSPPDFSSGGNKNLRTSRMAASDDEISRKGDVMRRMSSSAPPPPFSDSAIERELKGGTDENNNLKVGKDDVFDFTRPRAKSASPNASRSHPYFDRSRPQRSSSSLDALRPDSQVSCFPDFPFDNVTSAQRQYEELRWRDLSCAIEEMGEWSVDGVSEFLKSIGCDQYEEVFRDNCIDGDALPLLMEHHLVNNMGLKLGHALKIIARIHRRLGNQCALVSDRFSFSRMPVSMDTCCIRSAPFSRSGSSGSSSPQGNPDEACEQENEKQSEE